MAGTLVSLMHQHPLTAVLCVLLAGFVVLLLQNRQSKSGQKPSVQQKAQISNPELPTPAQTRNLIMKRRSIFPKDYSEKPVDRSAIEQLLEVANWAPTHGKTEPWRFVVLGPRERDAMVEVTLQALQETLAPETFVMYRAKIEGKKRKVYPRIQWMIGIVMKRQANPDKVMPEWEEQAACACAVQNMALMATSMGLAGYWSSWVGGSLDLPRFKAFIGCEDPEDRCLGFFIVGNADSETMAGYRSKRGPVEQKSVWREGA